MEAGEGTQGEGSSCSRGKPRRQVPVQLLTVGTLEADRWGLPDSWRKVNLWSSHLSAKGKFHIRLAENLGPKMRGEANTEMAPNSEMVPAPWIHALRISSC